MGRFYLKTAHYSINPDWSEEGVKEIAKKFIEGKQ